MESLGMVYQHYKGQKYRVLHVAKHTETNESLVIYRPVEGPHTIYARPHDLFFGNAELEGRTVPRFLLISQ